MRKVIAGETVTFVVFAPGYKGLVCAGEDSAFAVFGEDFEDTVSAVFEFKHLSLLSGRDCPFYLRG